MRRKDREIAGKSDIEAIIDQSLVVRLGLCDEGIPYIVPMNFGYRDGWLYMHTAREGKKLDLLMKNNRVCFEMDTGHRIVEADRACEWSMKYSSVIGFGRAVIVDDYAEKVKALNVIMYKYSGIEAHEYNEKEVSRVKIIKIEIESMTGKKIGD